jgi:hypothetical protein
MWHKCNHGNKRVMSFEIQAQTDGDDRGRQAGSCFGSRNLRLKYFNSVLCRRSLINYELEGDLRQDAA